MELLLIDLSSLKDNLESLVLAVLLLLGNRFLKWGGEYFKDKNKLFTYKTGASKEINTRLKELWLRLGAQRACVIEFSNTEKSLSGFPFTFFDMTHESVEENKISRVAHLFRKVHVSNYPTTVGNMDNPDIRYRMYHSDDPNLPVEISDMMKLFNIKTSLMYRLHPTKLMYGTVSVHWVEDFYRTEDNEYRPTHLDDKDAMYIRDAAAFILSKKKIPSFWITSVFSKNIN